MEKYLMNQMKKTMTKKELNKKMKEQRSQVSLGMNTGTRTMTSPRDFSRKRVKSETKKAVREACVW